MGVSADILLKYYILFIYYYIYLLMYLFNPPAHIPPGEDVFFSCTLDAPCLTIPFAMAFSDHVMILQYFYAAEAVYIGSATLFLASYIQTDPVAALAWSSSSIAFRALFTVTTGFLELRNITVWHNSSSKGAILNLTGNGNISLMVWNMFELIDYIL
jgi:hypothetical protein